MNIELTLCDKVFNGDIPSYQFKNSIEAIELFYHWIGVKKFDESVFVCFKTNPNLPSKELRNEQESILVSHNPNDILDFCEN